jgi:spermidine synthase
MTGEIPIVEVKSVRSSPQAPAEWAHATKHHCWRCAEPAWHPSSWPKNALPPYRGFCETCAPDERRWQAEEDRLAPHHFWNPRVITSGVHTYAGDYATHPNGFKLRKRLIAQRLLFYEEGINAIVTVDAYARHLDCRFLQIDGKTDASNMTDFPTEVLSADLPLLMHPDPREVLVVGLGSGITAGAVTRFNEVQRVDAIEIEAAVARAALFFADNHGDVLPDPDRRPPHPGHPKLRLMIRDARHYAAVTPKRYDVVISEPSNPWLSGPSHLFTLEHFRNLRRITKEDGISLQWLNTYSMTAKLVYSVIKTYRKAFDHVIVIVYVGRPGDLFMIGSAKPIAFDVGRMASRMAAPGVRRDLANVNVRTLTQLLTLLILGEDDLDQNLGLKPGRPAVAKALANIRINTDDFPFVEFEAPRYLHQQDSSLDILKVLYTIREDYFPPLVPSDDATLRDLRLCHELVESNLKAGLTSAAIRIAERGVTLHPGDRALSAHLVAMYLRRWIDARDQALPAKIRALDNRLIEQDPKDPLPHIQLGELETSLGAFDEAIRHYEQAVTLGGGVSKLHLRLGRACAEAGKHEKAIEAFERAVQLDPACLSAFDGMAQAYERLKKPERAMGVLMRWYDRESDSLQRNLILKRYEVNRSRLKPGSEPAGTTRPPDAP